MFELLKTSDTQFAVKVSKYSRYILFPKVTTVYLEGTQQLDCIAVLLIQMQGLTLSTPTSETFSSSSSQVLFKFSSSFHGN